MNELQVISKNGIQVIDSRDVAKMVDRRHDHLIRGIKKYCGIISTNTAPNFGVSDFFIESNYKDSTGRELPCYLLTKKGCDMVANKMTGEKGIMFTAAYVTAFEQMIETLQETKFKLPSYAEALRQLADKVEENEKLLIENSEMKPKAEFFDAVAESKTAIPMGEVAKVLDIKGIGRNKLFEFLRDKKVLMNNNIPYQKYIDCGYFRVIETKYSKPNGDTAITVKTLVYQKGLDYIRKLLKQEIEN